MITLDEAIEQERKQAEMYRCEYECECDYYGKDFIDDYADELDCIKNMQEHEQLAEWLEELKFIRQWKSDVMDEFCKYDCNSVEEARNNGYNKALDDFKKILTIEKIKEYAESDGFINLNNCSLMIFDIAEQLKVGGENEN